MSDRGSVVEDKDHWQEIILRLVRAMQAANVVPSLQTFEVDHRGRRETFAYFVDAVVAFYDGCLTITSRVQFLIDGRVANSWWIEEGVPHFSEAVGGGYLEWTGTQARSRVEALAGAAKNLQEAWHREG